MTVRRLSETEKQQILELYRLPGETTSTLASRFEVSNSTISRILKTNLPAADYEALIQQKKRGAVSSEVAAVEVEAVALEQMPLFEAAPLSEQATPTASTGVTVALAEAAPEAPELTEAVLPVNTVAATEARRLRKRSSAKDIAELPIEAHPVAALPVEVPPELTVEAVAPVAEAIAEVAIEEPVAVTPKKILKAIVKPAPKLAVSPTPIIAESLLDPADLHNDIADLPELDSDLDDDLDDLDDLDDDLDDDETADDSDGDNPSLFAGALGSNVAVEVLPFAAALIPRTCYLVVDRSAELVARPLRDFGDLGQIPEAEILEKTLPVFDNHRIAKRFSNPRTQRVIKLPDGKILQKTSSHLRAKGITRLLIDGQVYSLN